METYQTTEYNGKVYREVRRKANVGELVKVTGEPMALYNSQSRYVNGLIGDIYEVTESIKYSSLVTTTGKWADGSSLYLTVLEYVVLEEIGDAPEEPTPQLAGIHDSLASLAVEVTKLKSVVSALTGQLTPLQLAILNAENTPADVKLSLIVEAGRLESERQAKLDA